MHRLISRLANTIRRTDTARAARRRPCRALPRVEALDSRELLSHSPLPLLNLNPPGSAALRVPYNGQTMTANDVNNGTVTVMVGFAPLRPAEFVIFTIGQFGGWPPTS
jgi:hypothetical protein